MGTTTKTDYTRSGAVSTSIPSVPFRTDMWTGAGMKQLKPMSRTWILFFEQLVGALAENGGGIAEALAQSLQPINEVPKGTIDGANRRFTLSYAPLAEWLVLHLDNALEDPTADYALDGNVITFAIAPQPGDNMHAWYFVGAKETGGGSGAPPSLTSSSVGFARHFGPNASGDQIIWSPGTAFINLAGDMSFGCWLNLDNFSQPMGGANSICRAGAHAGGLQEGTMFWLEIIQSASHGVGFWDIEYKHNSIPVVVSNTFITTLSAGSWYYIGFSRQGRTLTLYIGNGVSLISAGSFTWPLGDEPNNQSQGGLFYVGNDGLGPGGSAVDGLGGAIEEMFIWSRAISLAEHTAAMQGSPASSALLFECLMGNGSPLDLGTSGASSTVTGTTVVTGHPVF